MSQCIFSSFYHNVLRKPLKLWTVPWWSFYESPLPSTLTDIRSGLQTENFFTDLPERDPAYFILVLNHSPLKCTVLPAGQTHTHRHDRTPYVRSQRAGLTLFRESRTLQRHSCLLDWSLEQVLTVRVPLRSFLANIILPSPPPPPREHHLWEEEDQKGWDIFRPKVVYHFCCSVYQQDALVVRLSVPCAAPNV